MATMCGQRKELSLRQMDSSGRSARCFACANRYTSEPEGMPIPRTCARRCTFRKHGVQEQNAARKGPAGRSPSCTQGTR